MQIKTARILSGSGLVAAILGMSGLTINYYQQRKVEYKEVMLRVYEELKEDQEIDINLLYRELLESPEYNQVIRDLGYKKFTEMFENTQKLRDRLNEEEAVRFIDTNSDTVRKFKRAVENLNDKL